MNIQPKHHHQTKSDRRGMRAANPIVWHCDCKEPRFDHMRTVLGGHAFVYLAWCCECHRPSEEQRKRYRDILAMYVGEVMDRLSIEAGKGRDAAQRFAELALCDGVPVDTVVRMVHECIAKRGWMTIGGRDSTENDWFKCLSRWVDGIPWSPWLTRSAGVLFKVDGVEVNAAFVAEPLPLPDGSEHPETGPVLIYHPGPDTLIIPAPLSLDALREAIRVHGPVEIVTIVGTREHVAALRTIAVADGGFGVHRVDITVGGLAEKSAMATVPSHEDLFAAGERAVKAKAWVSPALIGASAKVEAALLQLSETALTLGFDTSGAVVDAAERARTTTIDIFGACVEIMAEMQAVLDDQPHAPAGWAFVTNVEAGEVDVYPPKGPKRTWVKGEPFPFPNGSAKAWAANLLGVTAQPLRCETESNPVVVDIPQPSDAWMLVSNAAGGLREAVTIETERASKPFALSPSYAHAPGSLDAYPVGQAPSETNPWTITKAEDFATFSMPDPRQEIAGIWRKEPPSVFSMEQIEWLVISGHTSERNAAELAALAWDGSSIYLPKTVRPRLSASQIFNLVRALPERLAHSEGERAALRDELVPPRERRNSATRKAVMP